MKARRTRTVSGSRGQSLVETALVLPLLLLLVFNVVNVAYFFLVVVNLTGASRTSALYSIEGSYTPYANSQPASGSSNCTTSPNTVACLVFQDLTGAVWNPTNANNSIRVCSNSNLNSTGQGTNGSGASLVSNCQTCSATGCQPVVVGNPAPSPDPEAPNFVANEVTINYQFSPVIPGTFFNAALRAIPGCSGNTCTFSRKAIMRSMGP